MPGVTPKRMLSMLPAVLVAVALAYAFMSPQSASAAAPDAPQNVSATAGNGEIALSWDEPDDDGGEPITQYDAECVSGGHTRTSTTAATSTTVDGVQNGATYECTVTATNADGPGGESAPVTATPSDVPLPPQNISGIPGDELIIVDWDAPSDDGGSPITMYTAECRETTFPFTVAGTATTTPPTTDVEVTGLTNGEDYSCRVSATNDAGESLFSEVHDAVTPASVPDAPTGVNATDGEDASTTVSWDAGTGDGGDPITSFTATCTNGGASVSETIQDGSATSTPVTGLQNGETYACTVVATNDIGDSDPSVAANASPVAPAAAPSTPIMGDVTPGDQEVTVEWDEPLDDGGSPITSYTVEVTPADAGPVTIGDDEALDTSATVTGLTNGTEYTFTVFATNAVDDSPASAESDAVTPRTVPGTPGTPSIEDVRSGAADIAWTAPVDDGGAVITSYTVECSNDGVVDATQTVSDDADGDGDVDTAATVDGLANGEAYTCSVLASNEAGDGPDSAASEEFTPFTAPSAPTNISVNVGVGEVTVHWDAPGDDGGLPIDFYTATCTADGSTVTADADADERSVDVTGLENGTEYTCSVTATNEGGLESDAVEEITVTPAGTPDAPVNLAATAGDQAFMIEWEAPADDGGSPITGYEVSCENGDTLTRDVGADAREATFSGEDVTNGVTYECTVRAENDAGFSTASAAVTVTPSASGDLRVLTSVEVRPISGRVAVGRSLEFTALALDQNDAELSDLEYAWFVDGNEQDEDSRRFLFRATQRGQVEIGVEATQASTGTTVEAEEAVIDVVSPQPTPTPVILPPATNPMPEPMEVGDNGASGVFGPKDPLTLDLNLTSEQLDGDEPLDFQLDIPENAFRDNAAVTAVALTGSDVTSLPSMPDNVRQAAQVAVRVRVFVDGELVERPNFERQWRITLNIPRSVMESSSTGNIVVYRLPEGGDNWTQLRGTVNSANGTITITGNTLSTFRVAGVDGVAPTPTPRPTGTPDTDLPPTGGSAPTNTQVIVLMMVGLALIAGGGLYLRRRRGLPDAE